MEKYFSKQPYFSLNEWYEKIKSDNKLGNITADECYEIVRTLNLKAYESEYKIFIIWKPQLFGKEGNILLKSLEEPNGKTVFILVDESEELVLNTIVSRTQIIKIPRLSDSEVMHALIENQNISESEARKLARFAEGSYTVALNEMDHSEDISEKMLQEWIKTTRNLNIITLNEWIDAFVKLGREKQKVFIRYTLDFLRDCMITQSIGEQHSRLREEEVATAKWVAAALDFEVLQQWADMLEQTHFHIERNANPRVQMMSDSLKMYKLLNNKSISEVS